MESEGNINTAAISPKQARALAGGGAGGTERKGSSCLVRSLSNLPGASPVLFSVCFRFLCCVVYSESSLFSVLCIAVRVKEFQRAVAGDV